MASSPTRNAVTPADVLTAGACLSVLAALVLPLLTTAPRVANNATCAANLGQIAVAVQQYTNERSGALPVGWSGAAWWIAKRDLWFYQLADNYLRNPARYRCPQDPFGGQYDFEAPLNGVARSNYEVPSCGYGLNYVFRHWAINVESTPPLFPERTLMLADVGPDDRLPQEPLYAGAGDAGGMSQPWRDGGRLMWTDGASYFYDGPTWMTTRHGKTINAAVLDGSVRKVRTDGLLTESILPRYRWTCWRYDAATHKSVCLLCNEQYSHYDLSKSGLWWWTGAPLGGSATMIEGGKP